MLLTQMHRIIHSKSSSGLPKNDLKACRGLQVEIRECGLSTTLLLLEVLSSVSSTWLACRHVGAAAVCGCVRQREARFQSSTARGKLEPTLARVGDYCSCRDSNRHITGKVWQGLAQGSVQPA
jgi:hypothetical protein